MDRALGALNKSCTAHASTTGEKKEKNKKRWGRRCKMQEGEYAVTKKSAGMRAPNFFVGTLPRAVAIIESKVVLQISVPASGHTDTYMTSRSAYTWW